MLTHERLVELHRELADKRVLSVYIDGDQHDPAQRNTWRTRFEGGLAESRRALQGAAEEELEAFDGAAARVRDVLDGFDAFLTDKAFVAFATPDTLHHGEMVSVRMPDLIRWQDGIAVGPYVRGLKQERPVVVALLDSQRARVFMYRDGAVRETQDLRADTYVGDLTDTGVSKRSATRSGLRGETSTDAAQRFLGVATERMVKELAQSVAQRAGDHGFVVLGGTAEMEKGARDALPKSFEDRVLVEPSLHLEMKESEVREAVGDSASRLTKRWQVRLVEGVFDQARSGGRAAMGYEQTERALREMRVDTLLLSRTRMRGDADGVDRLVGLAFAGNAHVEEVAGAAGEKLDGESEGIAARLRFRVPEPGAEATSSQAAAGASARDA